MFAEPAAVPRSRSLPPHQSPVSNAWSEHLVGGYPEDVRSTPAVCISSLHSVAPLAGNQCAERRGRFHCGADPGERPESLSESGIFHESEVGEAVEPQPSGRRPGDGIPYDRAAIIPDQGRRISTKSVVEGAKREPAEAIEIAAAHPAAFYTRDEPRRHDGRSAEREPVALKVLMT